MGGSIRLESELGKGTRAIVEFPLECVDHPALDLGDTAVLHDARILVIDDRETNREIIMSYLEGCAAKVSMAHNTAAGWSMLLDASANEKPFHAAIIDMNMPDENGVEFARRVKENPQLSRLKIIIATSLNWHGDMAAIRAAGIDRLLTKPVRRDELVDAAARAITGTRHAGWRLTANAQPSSDAYTPALPSQMTFNACVLVAEDNPVNIEVAQEYLSSLGCTVSIATNGLEAVAAMASTRFDAVFMDCQMPVMDGLSATRRIRSMEAQLNGHHVPIIAVTANAFAEDRTRCLQSGMDDYLSKPYSEHQLRDMLAKWLPASRGRTADTVREEPAEDAALSPADRNLGPDLETPALDDNVIAPLRKARPDLLHRLIKTYLTYAPTALAELNAAMRDANFDELCRLAHSLKSSSANLGAIELSGYCRQLEQVAAGTNLSIATALVDNINSAFEKVRQCLAAEVETASPAADAAKATG